MNSVALIQTQEVEWQHNQKSVGSFPRLKKSAFLFIKQKIQPQTDCVRDECVKCNRFLILSSLFFQATTSVWGLFTINVMDKHM